MPGGDNPLYGNQQKQQARQLSARDEQDAASQCPACGNAVRVTADICEHCSHWLKEGQCCFCYTEVKAGQKFCRECGNPPLGITCPQCNTFSHFDFCPSCNTALSKRSRPYLEAFQQSPAFAELLQLSKMAEAGRSSPDTNKTASEIPNHLDQLKAYLQQFEKSADKKQTTGFTFNNDNTDASEALEKAAKQESISQPQDNTGCRNRTDEENRNTATADLRRQPVGQDVLYCH